MAAGSRMGMGEWDQRHARCFARQGRDADPRAAVRLRAQELKRMLSGATVRLSRSPIPDVFRERSPRRRSVLWPWLLAMLLGALSMLIPIEHTSSLRGRVQASAEGPHAVVDTRAAQCAGLHLDRPASVVVEAPGYEASVLEAQVLTLSPGDTGTCRIELALRADPDEPGLLQRLPAGAALRLAMPAQPQSWVLALLDRLPPEARVAEAESLLRSQLELLRLQYRTWIAPHLRQSSH